MTAAVRLSPSLPPDIHSNGVLGNLMRFVDRPDEPVLAVVSLATVRLVTDVPTGARMPTLGIQEIELACRSVSTAALRELLDTARRERIGVRGLPFESDVDELLRGGDR
jgi:hypothetical protein